MDSLPSGFWDDAASPRHPSEEGQGQTQVYPPRQAAFTYPTPHQYEYNDYKMKRYWLAVSV